MKEVENSTQNKSSIILTGDRPTGRLHLGHYVGSLRERVKLQNSGKYKEMYVMIADVQALTDNYGNPQKVRDNVIEVMLDYLSVGLEPDKTTFVLQSMIPALPELTQYYMNLVTLPRVLRNPTVKSEIKFRGFDKEGQGIPVGFATYPISQAADITAFNADTVPVGNDQLPMIEQAREIVKTFNGLYGEVLISPNPIVPEESICARLPGIDGNAKMSKSLNNCIYLSDSSEELRQKVMNMYTDPNHIKITDPGQVKGNMVFTYLDVFSKKEDFEKYLPEFSDLDDLKQKYSKGGVGDVKIKTFLYKILDSQLTPIREKRKYYEERIEEVLNILKDGTQKGINKTNQTLNSVKKAIGISYFENSEFLDECKVKFKNNK